MGRNRGTRAARRRVVVAVAVTATVAMGAGVAWAQIPSSDSGLISACFNKSAGTLRVIDYQSGARCSKNETLLQWKEGTGDNGIQAALNDEIAARASADSALQTALNDEIAARQAGDIGLQSALDGEAATRDAADTSFAGALAGLAVSDSTPNQLDDPVSFSKVKDLTGSIIGDYLDDSTVTSGKIQSLDGAKVTGTVSNATNATNASHAADLACTGCVDGTDLGGDAVTFTHITKGAVRGEGAFDPATQTPSTGNIALKTITHDNLANATVRGGQDGGPSAVPNEIADGTVTAFDLGSGSVGSGQIQDGSVSSDKVRANAAFASHSGLTTVLAAQPAVSVTMVVVDLPGSANHRVMVNGQLGLLCSTCLAPGSVVQYQLYLDGAGVGPTYSTSMSATQPNIVVPITWLGSLLPGARTFEVRVSANVTGVDPLYVTADTLSAVDLGRS